MRQHGFTLVEILLSVGILAALAGLSLPVYMSFVARNDLAVSAQDLASLVRRAELYSRSGHDDSAWSVHFASGSAVLYKGSDYAGRDTAHDETMPIPATVTVAGLGTVTFAKLTGQPSTTGAVTLSTATNTRILTLNGKGAVSY